MSIGGFGTGSGQPGGFGPGSGQPGGFGSSPSAPPAGGGFGSSPSGPPSGGGFGAAAPPSGGFGGQHVPPASGSAGWQGQHGAGQQPVPVQGAPARRGGAGRIVAAVGIPLALVLGVLGGCTMNAVSTSQLPAGQVEQAVVTVLREDFGLSDLERVDCPDRIENKQGAAFQCTFDYAGAPQSVTVTIGSGDGQLVVGSPDQAG